MTFIFQGRDDFSANELRRVYGIVDNIMSVYGLIDPDMKVFPSRISGATPEGQFMEQLRLFLSGDDVKKNRETLFTLYNNCGEDPLKAAALIWGYQRVGGNRSDIAPDDIDKIVRDVQKRSPKCPKIVADDVQKKAPGKKRAPEHKR